MMKDSFQQGAVAVIISKIEFLHDIYRHVRTPSQSVGQLVHDILNIPPLNNTASVSNQTVAIL